MSVQKIPIALSYFADITSLSRYLKELIDLDHPLP